MGRKEGKRGEEMEGWREKQRKSRRRGHASREAHLGCIVLVLFSCLFCVIKREKLDEARLTLISRRKIK